MTSIRVREAGRPGGETLFRIVSVQAEDQEHFAEIQHGSEQGPEDRRRSEERQVSRTGHTERNVDEERDQRGKQRAIAEGLPGVQ